MKNLGKHNIKINRLILINININININRFLKRIVQTVTRDIMKFMINILFELRGSVVL